MVLLRDCRLLHSRPTGQKSRVRVRPTLLGAGCISMLVALASVLLVVAFIPSGPDKRMANQEVIWPAMAGCSFVAFYFSVMKLREFFRSVEMMGSELQQFRLDACLCHCCATNHEFSKTCDRRILTICISKWFGSIDLFETLMCSEVLACLTEQLLGLTSHLACSEHADLPGVRCHVYAAGLVLSAEGRLRI